jgi:hypothetical protein
MATVTKLNYGYCEHELINEITFEHKGMTVEEIREFIIPAVLKYLNVPDEILCWWTRNKRAVVYHPECHEQTSGTLMIFIPLTDSEIKNIKRIISLYVAHTKGWTKCKKAKSKAEPTILTSRKVG